MGKISLAILMVSLSVTLTGCTSPMKWWKSVKTKIHTLLDAKHENILLQQKLVRVEKRFYELEHKYQHLLAEVEILRKTEDNVRDTGTREGRSLASISYDVPVHLTTGERYSLAFEHFAEGNYEAAAKTFESFLSVPEGAAYHDSNAFYEAGVSWFKLKNFKKARERFEAAAVHAKGDTRDKILQRVDLWMKIMNKQSLDNPLMESGARMPASSGGVSDGSEHGHGGGNSSMVEEHSGHGSGGHL